MTGMARKFDLMEDITVGKISGSGSDVYEDGWLLAIFKLQ
jgi:hypothetical protein